MTTELTPEQQLDAAYRERAHLVAWLAAMFPAVIAPAPDVDEPGWQIVYLKFAGWQGSWHISPRDLDLFGHVPQVSADDPRAQWDGHTTQEKYWRIRQHTAELAVERTEPEHVHNFIPIRHWFRTRWLCVRCDAVMRKPQATGGTR